jgi:glutamate-5-semialdehyde dehydrogenase
MAEGLCQVVDLPDPVGEVTKVWQRPSGLEVKKVRVPIGVIGVVYEARPNVTADVAGLCLKSGNAAILKGGSEAINSNLVIANILSNAAEKSGLPEGCLQPIATTDRQAVLELLKLDRYVDLIVPRGSEEFIKMVKSNSTIPVIGHGSGVCHIYVDNESDLDMAERVCFNAKVQRPGVCNAMETLLVHKDIAQNFIPSMFAKFQSAKVELRCCPKTLSLMAGFPNSNISNLKPATEDDWYAEYLDLILSVRIVDDINEAIDHISTYGSHHSDAIITKNSQKAMKFTQEVDSAAVFVNASTRFTDGYEFGLGAEVGISNQKLHSRGPMGLEDLTSQKFVVIGNGQIRE